MKFDFRNGTFSHLRSAPAATALVHPGGKMSWQSLHTATRAWMGRAVAAGARADRPVVVLGQKEAAFVAAVLGCLALGVPYVPVDSLDSVDRIRQIVDISRASVIYDTAADRFIPGPPGADDLDEADLACIFFPSSTKELLGVQIGRESLAPLAKWIQHHVGLGPAPVFMDHMPFSYDFPLFNLIGALGTGGTCVLCPRDVHAQGSGFVHQLAKHRVTVLAATPTFVRQQLSNPHFAGLQLPDLGMLVLGGEPICKPLVDELRERFPKLRIVSAYGSTEVTGLVAWTELDHSMQDPVSGNYTVGRARRYAEIFIRNGEICVAGSQVMRGYINAPSLNEIRLFAYKGKRAYRTGDAGTIDERGLVHSRGRRDGKVQLHGFRLELGEVDSALTALPGVRGGVATALHREDGTFSHIVGVVEPVDAVHGAGIQPLPESLRRWRQLLAARLPVYMMPSELVACSPLPTTDDDRVDRQKLEAMYRASRRELRRAWMP